MMNDKLQMTNGLSAGKSAGSLRNLHFTSFDIRNSAFDILPIHHLAPAGPGTFGGMAGFVLANGSMSSNQSGDCPARSAMKTPKAKPQSLPRQRDIRRALIEADLVDTALRDSAFPPREATLQVLSKVKNNMVALPGQLFYSTQIPVCLWFIGKNGNSGGSTFGLN